VKSQFFLKISCDLVPVPNNSPAKAAGARGKVLRTIAGQRKIQMDPIAGLK
jgi:hypothetical protein